MRSPVWFENQSLASIKWIEHTTQLWDIFAVDICGEVVTQNVLHGGEFALEIVQANLVFRWRSGRKVDQQMGLMWRDARDDQAEEVFVTCDGVE